MQSEVCTLTVSQENILIIWKEHFQEFHNQGDIPSFTNEEDMDPTEGPQIDSSLYHQIGKFKGK